MQTWTAEIREAKVECICIIHHMDVAPLSKSLHGFSRQLHSQTGRMPSRYKIYIWDFGHIGKLDNFVTELSVNHGGEVTFCVQKNTWPQLITQGSKIITSWPWLSKVWEQDNYWVVAMNYCNACSCNSNAEWAQHGAGRCSSCLSSSGSKRTTINQWLRCCI